MKNKAGSRRRRCAILLLTVLFIAAATGIGALFRLWQFPETNIVVVYILSVVLTARCTDGYLWGILSTILSTCAFNAFFTAPYFTLSVDDPTYLITFAIMAMTSIITSALTSKAKKMTAEAVPQRGGSQRAVSSDQPSDRRGKRGEYCPDCGADHQRYDRLQSRLSVL